MEWKYDFLLYYVQFNVMTTKKLYNYNYYLFVFDVKVFAPPTFLIWRRHISL